MYSTWGNIKSSFKLAWKNKILWIFAVMAMGNASFNFNGSNYGRSDSKKDNLYMPKIVSEKVLGVATEFIAQNPVTTSIHTRSTPPVWQPRSLFEGVNPAIIIGTIVTLTLFILFFITILFLVKSWAQSALIYGSIKKIEASDQNLEFKDLGTSASVNWKRILYLNFYMLFKVLKLFIISILLMTLLVVISAFLKTIGLFISAILLIIFLPYLFWYFIKLSIYYQYALRVSVEEGVKSKEAFNKGTLYFKTRPGKIIKLFLMQIFLGILMVLVISLFLFAIYVLTNSLPLIIGLLVVIFTIFGIVGIPYVETFSTFCISNLYLYIKNNDIKVDSLIPPLNNSFLPEVKN